MLLLEVSRGFVATMLNLRGVQLVKVFVEHFEKEE